MKEKILVVENDPIIRDFLVRQSLEAAGYTVSASEDSSSALSTILKENPDAVMINLALPGLSGKDLIAALAAQHADIPIVVVSKKGGEADIISAFRLGAADYLVWPVREAEVVAVVERVLKQVRNRREREELAGKLQNANFLLQQRVRELTTIYGVGKMVTSITDQSLLFERILEGAISVTLSDMGWFLLLDEISREFRMVAQRNLPESLAQLLNQPWDDGLSSLVAMSGESLAVHGPALRRFKIASLGQAVLIVPVKVQKTVIGMLVMIRKQAKDYSTSEQHLLEAVTDYASISLANARLFRALEDRADSLQRLVENAQAGGRIHNDLMRSLKNELRSALQAAPGTESQAARAPISRWTTRPREQNGELNALVRRLSRIVESIRPLEGQPSPQDAPVNLSEVVYEAVEQFQHYARGSEMTLVSDVPTTPLMVMGVREHFDEILGGLLSNAIKFNRFAGQVSVRLKPVESTARIEIIDTGAGVPIDVFDTIKNRKQPRPGGQHYGGLGIGLELVNELVTRHRGKLWFNSKPGEGSHFSVAFPLISNQETETR